SLTAVLALRTLIPPTAAADLIILQVLGVAYILGSVAGPTGSLLSMLGRPVLVSMNTAILWGLTTALCLLLVPTWGAVGAAAGYLVAVGVIKVVEMLEVRFCILGWGIDARGVAVLLVGACLYGWAFW